MQSKFTNVIQKALTLKPWVTKTGPNRYRVIPRTADHGKYVLTYSFDGDLPVVESCTDERTGEECKGFRYAGHCYHQAALVRHLFERQIRKVA